MGEYQTSNYGSEGYLGKAILILLLGLMLVSVFFIKEPSLFPFLR